MSEDNQKDSATGEGSHPQNQPHQPPAINESTPTQFSGPDDPKDNTSRPPNSLLEQQSSLPGDPKDNTPRLIGGNPGDQQSTPTTSQQEGQALDAQPRGLRLRSGTILPGPQQVSPPVINLSKYLNSLLEEAREPGGCSVSLCDALDKRLAQTRERRRAQITKLKEDTERFRSEILQLEGFARSRSFVNTNSIQSESVSIKESDVSASGSPSGEIVIGWLDDSLPETSPSDTSFGTVSFVNRPPKFVEMADYSKVAKLTAQLVPLFSGDPHPKLSLELQTFLGCCNQVIQCLTEEEHSAFLQIFPTRLRGEAYQLFASNIPATFKECEERLNRTYLPRETYQELVNKLITTRQYPLENLATFTSRVKQLLALCKEASDSKYGAPASTAVKIQLEDFAKNALKTGVSDPHLCQYLLTLGDNTLEELIQKALDMERLQQSAHFLRNPQIPFYSPQLVQSIPPEQIPAGPTLINAQRQQPTYPQFTPALSSGTILSPKKETNTFHVQENKNKILNKVICRFCNNRGHTYADCLKRKNTPYCVNCKMYNHDVRDCRRNREPPRYQNRSPPNQPFQKGANPNGPRIFNVRLKCEFCDRNGHDVTTCPHKRKWENKSQGNDKQSTQNSPARL